MTTRPNLPASGTAADKPTIRADERRMQGGGVEATGVRRIQPVKRRLKISDLPRDLPVVRVVAGRDFKVKYKQSLLGPLWLVLQPLALLAAFLVAFRGPD